MNTKSLLPAWMSGRRAALGVAVSAVLGLASVPTHADQSAATAVLSRIADVSLADLDLSTPKGMRLARDRLLAMAQRVCAGSANSRDLSSQPNFVVCVDSTLAVHLKQLNALASNKVSVRQSVTRAANVSLADLNLSTLDGSRAARERLEAMARRLCTELARSRELTFAPNYAACVHDTLEGAWAQASVIRATKETRTAQRAMPESP
jgi:UrcA family protein